MSDNFEYRPYKNYWFVTLVIMLGIPLYGVVDFICIYYQNEITAGVIFALLMLFNIFYTKHSFTDLRTTYTIGKEGITFSAGRKKQKTFQWQKINYLFLAYGSKAHHYLVLSTKYIDKKDVKDAVYKTEWLMKYTGDDILIIPLGLGNSKNAVYFKEQICSNLSHLNLNEVGAI